MKSRISAKSPDSSFGLYNSFKASDEVSDKLVKTENTKKITKKKGGLKSLQILVAILLSKIGQMGARDLLSLIAIVVSILHLHIRSIQLFFHVFASCICIISLTTFVLMAEFLHLNYIQL